MVEGSSTDLIFSASYQRVSPPSSSRDDMEDEDEGAGIEGGGEGHRESRLACLEPARLNCTFKKLDLVTSVQVHAVVDDSELEGGPGGAQRVSELSSGTPFSLQVVLTSEDCNFLSEPRLGDLKLVIKHAEGGGKLFSIVNLVADMDDFLAAGRFVQGQVSDHVKKERMNYNQDLTCVNVV